MDSAIKAIFVTGHQPKRPVGLEEVISHTPIKSRFLAISAQSRREDKMNSRDIQTEEFARRASAYYQACRPPGHAQVGQRAFSRRRFLRTAVQTAVIGSGLAAGLGRLGVAAAHGNHSPVPIPGGTPVLGGAFHVFGPELIDPADAEPSSITDFNGFVGIAFISGTVTRTNTKTGEVRTLPFVDSDMRFMNGTFRGTDGQIHQGAFGFI